MAFLGSVFSGFRNALLKCIRNSSTPKEVIARHLKEEEGDSTEGREESNTNAAHQPDCGCVNEAEGQLAGNNNLSHSYLEKITGDSDSPSDFSSSYEKIGDDGVFHEYADNHESMMEDVFTSTENLRTGSLQSSFSTGGTTEEKLADEVDGSNTWTLDVRCKLIDKLPFLNLQRSHSRYIYLGILQPNAFDFDKMTHELEECKVSQEWEKPLENALLAMKQRGYTISTYRIKKSQCLALLLNIIPAHHIVERYRFELQRDVGILIPHDDTAATDALAFSYLVAEFVAQFSQQPKESDSELPIAEKEKIRVICHGWSEAIATIFLHVWKIETEKIYQPDTATLNDASPFMSADHRLKIENIARKVASEIIDA